MRVLGIETSCDETGVAIYDTAFTGGRGLSSEVINTYGIGYAPGGWEALKQHLSAKGIGESVQVEYGLLIHREDTGRTYDRFRDRVMFPIRDLRGRTLGFGGRVMGDEQPKYLNSPETPVFHKGRELYGLYIPHDPAATSPVCVLSIKKKRRRLR